MESIISVSNLKKSFKSHAVLKGVSFEVKRGGIFALLGSNGAGKTTTINILATLTKADGGRASISGYDCFAQKSSVKKSISLTGQYATTDGLLTGRENLILIGKLKNIKNPKKTADELLKKFNLVEAGDKLSSTYSGGMKRRLDIAMSLIGDPDVIFLDEPTTGLDPQNRLAMWELVKEMQSSGKTIFLTTQYLEEAEALANYIAILHEGKIAAEGTAEELKSMFPSGKMKITFDDDPGIIEKLKNAGLKALNVEQERPSLEDVFFATIGHEKGGNGDV
ncbi:MAG: ATP-binding cassette domain-containing protein [Defluviitaleaceae bacterium]|nr:ATP-binding cassette domain-containing protein [Defluviitaleaceae bacterium]